MSNKKLVTTIGIRRRMTTLFLFCNYPTVAVDKSRSIFPDGDN
jgi:hypothetical protein